MQKIFAAPARAANQNDLIFEKLRRGTESAMRQFQTYTDDAHVTLCYKWVERGGRPREDLEKTIFWLGDCQRCVGCFLGVGHILQIPPPLYSVGDARLPVRSPEVRGTASIRLQNRFRCTLYHGSRTTCSFASSFGRAHGGRTCDLAAPSETKVRHCAGPKGMTASGAKQTSKLVGKRASRPAKNFRRDRACCELK